MKSGNLHKVKCLKNYEMQIILEVIRQIFTDRSNKYVKIPDKKE